MKNIIETGKLVELKYKVIDEKSGEKLLEVEYPISFVQGANDILSPEVLAELEGKTVGDVIEVPIDCNLLYGPRDETLVFTDKIENVPEDYREIGLTITMENDKGDQKNFIVTRIDDETLTVDGNNPLCGRKVIFMLDVITVRDATEEEIECGGLVGADPSLEQILQNN